MVEKHCSACQPNPVRVADDLDSFRVHPPGDGGIESLQLSAGALEDSRSEHGLGQLQTAYHVFQEVSALTLGHGSLLP